MGSCDTTCTRFGLMFHRFVGSEFVLPEITPFRPIRIGSPWKPLECSRESWNFPREVPPPGAAIEGTCRSPYPTNSTVCHLGGFASDDCSLACPCTHQAAWRFFDAR